MNMLEIFFTIFPEGQVTHRRRTVGLSISQCFTVHLPSTIFVSDDNLVKLCIAKNDLTCSHACIQCERERKIKMATHKNKM